MSSSLLLADTRREGRVLATRIPRARLSARTQVRPQKARARFPGYHWNRTLCRQRKNLHNGRPGTQAGTQICSRRLCPKLNSRISISQVVDARNPYSRLPNLSHSPNKHLLGGGSPSKDLDEPRKRAPRALTGR